MIYERVQNRLRGTVRLHIECAYPERIINLMSARGLYFWDLQYESETGFSCVLAKKDAAVLRALAEKQGARCETLAVRGAPFFFYRFRRRYILLVSLALVSLALGFGSFFIWEFELEGEAPYSEQQILRVLSEEGVHLGTYGRSIDSELLRNRVLLRLPELSWISVNVSGCKAHVQVRQRIHAPGLIGELPPQNIVAKRSGVVTNVASQGGKAVVHTGSTVEKGEMLISGYVDYGGSAVRLLPAAGRVEARTWYTLHTSLPLMREEKQYGEKVQHGLALVFGTKRIKIFGRTGICHEECDTIINRKHWHLFSLPLPVVSVWESRRSYTLAETARSDASVQSEGEELLRSYLASALGDGEILADTAAAKEKNGRLFITFRAECLEDIAEVQTMT